MFTAANQRFLSFSFRRKQTLSDAAISFIPTIPRLFPLWCVYRREPGRRSEACGAQWEPDPSSLLDRNARIHVFPSPSPPSPTRLYKICKCNHPEWPHVSPSVASEKKTGNLSNGITAFNFPINSLVRSERAGSRCHGSLRLD